MKSVFQINNILSLRNWAKYTVFSEALIVSGLLPVARDIVMTKYLSSFLHTYIVISHV